MGPLVFSPYRNGAVPLRDDSFPNTSHVPKVLGLGCGSSRFTSLPIPMGKETFEFQMKHFFKRDQIVRAIAPNFSLVEMSDFPQRTGIPVTSRASKKNVPAQIQLSRIFLIFLMAKPWGFHHRRVPEIPGSNFGLSGSVAQMEEILLAETMGM